MEEPTELSFFVYVVESPSAKDIYHGRSEGGLLAQALALGAIPCVSRTAIDSEAFEIALKLGLPEAMKRYPDRLPMLHVSAHGSDKGIQLSSGEPLTWDALQVLLRPINESLSGVLVLCMSACEGYFAGTMAMEEEPLPHPFYAMVGNSKKPTWSDTAVSYLAFYHLISKGRLFPEAVAAMNAVCGDDGWVLHTAEELKTSYLEYLRGQEVEPAQVRRELEAVASQQPPDAKALEGGG